MTDRNKSCERKQHVTLLSVLLFVMLGAFLATTQTLAQNLPNNDERNEPFRRHFQTVVALNSDIKDFQKMDIGRIYCLPGGKLEHLDQGDKNGIWGREFRKFYGISYEDWLKGEALPSPTPSPTPNPSPSPTQETATVASTWPEIPWWIWVLALLAGLLIFGVWLYRKNGTRWRPMVRGGVDDQAAQGWFNQQAQRRRATVIPGSIERVRLYGPWLTQHRGIPIPIPHSYNGEQAYRARFRMENGDERVGYMLQGCGNDVAAGRWYTGLPGSRVEEGWGDNSQVASTQASQTNVAQTSTDADPIEEGVLKFEMRRATGDRPAMMRLSGIDEEGDNTIERRPGEIVIRFTEPRGSGF